MADFIRSWKFMAIIVGVLCVVAGVGVAIAVSTHTEPGIMAETPGFTASDVPIGVCTLVYVGDDAALEDAISAVGHAVSVTNERLGAEVLHQLDGEVGGSCRVRVTVGVPSEAGWRDPGGDAAFTNGQHQCLVTTNNTGTVDMLDLVLQHELGHCLGLAHDDYTESIMYGGPGRALRVTSGFPPHISDSDRELLRHQFVP